jgi:hypothetical protein
MAYPFEVRTRCNAEAVEADADVADTAKAILLFYFY